MKKIWLFILIISLLSCKKDSPDPIDSTQKGKLQVEFDNIVGNFNLTLNTRNYVNSSGETFNISQLRYFVSNFKLKNINGNEFTIPQADSYFLIDEAFSTSQTILLEEIPEGDYNEISFTIGVDSLRSTMDINQRVGALDPSGEAQGMYWNQNQGYIFFKMEGSSPQITNNGQGENKFYYHIGGFGGINPNPTINNLQTVKLNFNSDIIRVRDTSAPTIHLEADILKIFNTSPTISLVTHPIIQFEDFSKNVSANYSKMFKYSHLHEN